MGARVDVRPFGPWCAWDFVLLLGFCAGRTQQLVPGSGSCLATWWSVHSYEIPLVLTGIPYGVTPNYSYIDVVFPFLSTDCGQSPVNYAPAHRRR